MSYRGTISGSACNQPAANGVSNHWAFLEDVSCEHISGHWPLTIAGLVELRSYENDNGLVVTRILRMLRCMVAVSLVSLGLSDIAAGQTGVDESPVPLTDAARDGIGGDWVHISELNLQKIEAARTDYCNKTMFSGQEMQFVWAYDNAPYRIGIPVLENASGHLSFRWNNGDDLYLASTRPSDKDANEGPDVTVYRMGALRMQNAPGKVGISWGWAKDISPANEYANVGQWTRNHFLIEELTNNTTGQSFLLLAFPLSATYQTEEDSKLYVKCQ